MEDNGRVTAAANAAEVDVDADDDIGSDKLPIMPGSELRPRDIVVVTRWNLKCTLKEVAELAGYVVRSYFGKIFAEHSRMYQIVFQTRVQIAKVLVKQTS